MTLSEEAVRGKAKPAEKVTSLLTSIIGFLLGIWFVLHNWQRNTASQPNTINGLVCGSRAGTYPVPGLLWIKTNRACSQI
jgi:uncharacterized membrane protein YphA (DoxX/SURF4 family)